jgi:hypothetical protein
MISKLVVATLTITSGSAILYALYLHRSLSGKVQHSSDVGLPSRQIGEDNTNKLDSLPLDLHMLPSNYHIVHDVCHKSIPNAQLHHYSDPSRLLTTYLRRNMSLFATRLPQAWFLKYAITKKVPALAPSFDPAHIQTLDFVTDDVVAGVYRVVVRKPMKCEFAMAVPEGMTMPSMDGRLVVRIEERGEQCVFVGETLQWKSAEQRGLVLPLERRMMRWIHEIAAWWLLESGTDYLVELGKQEQEEKRKDERNKGMSLFIWILWELVWQPLGHSSVLVRGRAHRLQP